MTDFTRPDPVPGTDTDTTVTPTPQIPAAPVEPAVEPVIPVATTPVGADATAAAAIAPKRSRMRWFAAIGVIALVVAGSAAAALMLTGASPAATVMGYVPSDSVMYGEIRLDLPGDQKREIGEFLSKFPGFADQAALDTKLDEVLDRLVSDATDGEQTFSADIKPWFDGEMAVAVGPLPDAAALTDPESVAADGRALVLLSIKDEALARAWFDGVMAESGATGVPETYEGVELTIFAEPEMAGAQAAFAIVGGKVAMAGDVTSVKAAIDTNGDAGLSDDPAFSAAADAMDGDHVGLFYVDIDALMDAALELSQQSGDTPQVSESMLALVPDWAAFRLRVEGDALVMDGAMPHNASAPGPDTNRANGVADWAPPATIVLAAGNDLGATLLEMIELYRSDPAMGEFFTGLDEGAGMLGGVDAVLGWMGDAGLVISQDGDAFEGGLVVLPTDADAASQLLTTIRSFATLGGGAQGITVRDEDYNGATITIIDLGSAQDLAAMAGALGGLPTDPSTTSGLPEGNIEIAYAATGDVVVLGSGPDFVKSVLDAGAGASLADESRYRDLVARVGTEHTGVTFVDITAIRGVLEGFLGDMPAADRAEYEESIKPFLTPFDAFVAATTVGGELDSQHTVITVK
jgi:Protein of unknown function (DUF3352)